MADITFKSLSALTPIELKYEYYKDEELQTSLLTYTNGQSFYEIDGFTNYQDVTINKESCFVLTTAVNLSSVFTSTKEIILGELPASIILQPRDSFIYSLQYDGLEDNITISLLYDSLEDNFTVSLTSNSILYIKPINNFDEIELKLNGDFLQVEENYPYEVKLRKKSLDPESINRQRFYPFYRDGLITFRTLTKEGFRYLALGNDFVLRATGLILNNTIINDYVFKCIPVTQDILNRGFISANNWITYYFDIESGTENKTVNINKNITPLATNLLIDFPAENAAKTGVANINVANLKTYVTPTGGPASIENSYTKETITTN